MIGTQHETDHAPGTLAVLQVHSQRRITASEQRRLYELERRGEKPLLSDRAYAGRSGSKRGVAE